MERWRKRFEINWYEHFTDVTLSKIIFDVKKLINKSKILSKKY